MRTSFEFKIFADDITEAESVATEKIAKFLNLPEDAILDSVTMELKVSYPEAKTFADIASHMDGNTFVVTVFGSVKPSAGKPFGFDLTKPRASAIL